MPQVTAPSAPSRRRVVSPSFGLKHQPPGPPSRRPGSHGSSQGFRPGEVILESGIYEVIHHRGHRETHDAVMIRANRFPSCEQCGDLVRFKMKRTAPYIFHDDDFTTD